MSRRSSDASNDRQIAALNVQMENSLQRTFQQSTQERPAATNAQYDPKVSEFKDWCTMKGFPEFTKFTVTESKLHLFLEECVIGRKRKTRSSEQVGSIGYQTVLAYVSAITDFYKQQQVSGINSNPNPRGNVVKALLKNVALKNESTRRSNFEDRGKGTMLDVISSVEDLRKIATHYMEKNNRADLRNRAMFLVSHFGMMRGQDVRQLDLADTFALYQKDETFIQDCLTMVSVIRQGKTNHFGKKLMAGFLRNRDVEVCPIGSVGFLLFYRFMIGLEPFPDTNESQLWYNIKLFHNWSDIEKELTYNTHKDAVQNCFKDLGFKFSSVTHIGRKSAANMADSLGAAVDSIRRAGRWNTETVTNVYMSALPKDVLRILAGFSAEGNSYFLPRACFIPCEELQLKIFPQVDHLLEQQNIASQCNLAAQGFLLLLKALRIVILQDAVLIRQKHPRHLIFSHSLFQSEEYLDFENSLLEKLELLSTESDPRLADVNSVIAENLVDINKNLSQKIDDITAIQSEFVQYNKRIEDKIDKLLRKKIRVSVNADWNDEDVSEIESCDEKLIIESYDKVNSRQIMSVPQASTDIFIMNRSIQTVADALKEWCHGINGYVSVEFMDNKYKANWRKSQKGKQFYSRRTRLIRLVYHLADKKQINVQSAAEELERRRKQQACSLDYIQKHISEFEEL